MKDCTAVITIHDSSLYQFLQFRDKHITLHDVIEQLQIDSFVPRGFA